MQRHQPKKANDAQRAPRRSAVAAGSVVRLNDRGTSVPTSSTKTPLQIRHTKHNSGKSGGTSASTSTSASEARVRRALDGVLAAIRAGRPNAYEPTMIAFARAAEAAPDALPEARQLQALAAAARRGAGGDAAKVAFTALGALLNEASPAYALHVARADGVAAALLAGIGSAPDAHALAPAAKALELAVQHPGAARVLVERAPGLARAATTSLAACAAALKAGGAADLHTPAGASLVDALVKISMLRAPGSAEARAIVEPVVPATVAMLARPTEAVDAAAMVRLTAMVVAAAAPGSAAAAKVFAGAGSEMLAILLKLLACAAADLRLRGGDPGARAAALSNAWCAGALIGAACRAGLAEPKLLATEGAMAWAAHAELLAGELGTLLEAVEANDDGGGGSGCSGCSGGVGVGVGVGVGDNVVASSDDAARALRVAVALLPLVKKWRALARDSAIRRQAACCAAAWDSGGSLPAMLKRRRCAACGRTPADGARLHRCRGCGPLTAVMYCGNACAREHWVRGGHRKVCEPASAQLDAARGGGGAVHGVSSSGGGGRRSGSRVAAMPQRRQQSVGKLPPP